MNDLISREALKKAIKDSGYSHYFEIFDIIDNAEPIDMTKPMTKPMTCPNCDSGYAQGYSDGYLKGKEDRPHGKWIFNKYTGDIICSCCRQSRRDTRANHIFFCNHCGAKMDGGEE